MNKDQLTLIVESNSDIVLTLLKAGVFSVPDGKVEINFHNGQVQSVHIHRMTYKRESSTMKE